MYFLFGCIGPMLHSKGRREVKRYRLQELAQIRHY